MNELEHAVREAVLTLPPAHVEKFASAVMPFEGPSVRSRNKAVGALGAANYRAKAAAIHKAWEGCGGAINGAGLAAALRTAAGVAFELRLEQTIEIAWTGPMTEEVPLRRTREVLIALAREAQKSLILVSFAAHRTDTVLKELSAAAARGVEVILILEDKENSKGKLSRDARDAFEELGDQVSFYVWPAEKRPRVGHGVASMHAKAAIADRTAALISSVNLTGAAIEDNMELGLLVRGGDVPRRLEAHFRELIGADELLHVIE